MIYPILFYYLNAKWKMTVIIMKSDQRPSGFNTVRHKSRVAEGDDMIKDKKLAFGLFVVLAVVLWNLLDYLWSAFITGSPYHFSLGTDVGVPLLPAIIIGYLLFLRNKEES